MTDVQRRLFDRASAGIRGWPEASPKRISEKAHY